MKRRQWLTFLPLAFAAASAHAQPSYTVTSAQLQQAVAEKFPMRYPVGGLLELTLQPPRLRLLPEQNRLGTVMVVDAAGPALSRSGSGNFDVDFALRYEASDQSIRAHQLKVNTLSLSGLPPGPAALLQAYGPALAQQSLLEVVLHKLQPKDLMLADGLGMEPGAITVTARGLMIGFVPKKRL
ncbi:DUF1439 domain-containing protein [Polaromonas eurypsychrophila]|uniref:DUF1439 domain-containing protein n=1 Tax=Polaromonas eurypsychrophila TaxID=1614635 RepID=A0A916S9C6_9BURK|nr:DUF1439 domain-containing protein [Polaromonas eurypsychrophila]GGA89998.1 hypothetical protein GCM10011496_08560 [Polaromonas eurypsychrophila]